jgi:hypothetical protein
MQRLKLLSAVAALAMLGAAMPVSAQYQAGQYRPDQPPVASPMRENPEAGNDSATASFRQWNRREKNPTIMVFWSRTLSDDATDDFNSYFSEVIVATPWVLSTYQEAGTQRKTDSRDQRLGRQLSEGLQGAFMNTLIEGGGSVIDREALMRKVALKQGKADRSDKQNIESLALAQGVQYLVQIVPDKKPGSVTELTFNIKVIYLPTSAIKAQFVASGKPPPGPTSYVTTSRGYQKVTETRMTVENIGAQIAYDTMAKFR